MRIVFMGSPDFAKPTLAALIGSGFEVVAVYSQPPKPAGRRGLELTPTPVAEMAAGFGIPVFTPLSLKSNEEQAQLKDLQPDLIVVVAYGLLLPQAVLDIPQHGCLNLHGSLLPRWRGAAPIHRAIMAGDKETGVGIMRMEKGLDTGPVAMEERIAIAANDTTLDVHDRLASLGADLMVRASFALSRGALEFKPQAESGVTYAHKIDKAEAKIDWSQSAFEVHNHIRALTPFPGAYAEADLGKGVERVKILRAELADGFGQAGTVLNTDLTIACGTGAIRLLTLQRAGKAALSTAEFQRGANLKSGAVFM
jgi:methionyl-tRNA formyltransferase